jgi:cytidine deaminase
MTNKELKIAYTEYTAADQLEQVEQELVEAAIEATKTSYAPYSNFNVGAAVRLEDGQIVKGSNQENAAYPSGICAERTAMFYASANYPENTMTAIAITASQNGKLCAIPATPCGRGRRI